MYIAWKGDGNDNLNVMVSTDSGQTFGNKFISPEESPGPGARRPQRQPLHRLERRR
jgi:hypothetical protein